MAESADHGPSEGFDLHALTERADRQGQEVEDLHLAAIRRTLPQEPRRS